MCGNVQDMRHFPKMHRLTNGTRISDQDLFDLLSRAVKVSDSKKYESTLQIDGREITYSDSLTLVKIFLKLNLNYGILKCTDEVIAYMNDQDLSLYPFVEHGADIADKIPNVNKPDQFGRTAIFYARSNENVKSLLKHGANPNHIDNNGDNFLAILPFVPDFGINKTNINNENHQGECILLKHFTKFTLSFRTRSIYYRLLEFGYEPTKHFENMKKMMNMDKNLYIWLVQRF